MDGAVVSERIREASPDRTARIAGVFYLLTFVTGACAAFFNGPRLAPYNNTANLIATAFYLGVLVLFYELFKPVNRIVSAIAAGFSFAGCAVSVLNVFHLISVHVSALVFFGVYCLLIGYLILRSTFLPRVLGVLMALGCVGWLTFLSASFAHRLSPYNLAPGMLGEGALTVWLLVKGVHEQRWREQARTAGRQRA